MYITNTEFIANYILLPFCCCNVRLWGSINFTVRELLLFYRVVNGPTHGNAYYTQQLQTSLSSEILGLYLSSTYVYVYRIRVLFKTDE